MSCGPKQSHQVCSEPCMPRFSSAYSDLIRRVKEVESIVAMARGIRPVTQAHITRNKALCRGGIVLLCSHIEGFIEALGTLAVTRIADNAIPKSSLAPAFRYHLSQDLINGVKEAATPEAFVSSLDHLLYRDANVWDNSVDSRNRYGPMSSLADLPLLGTTT